MSEVPLYCSRRRAAGVEEQGRYIDCIRGELYIYKAARHSGHLAHKTTIPSPGPP